MQKQLFVKTNLDDALRSNVLFQKPELYKGLANVSLWKPSVGRKKNQRQLVNASSSQLCVIDYVRLGYWSRSFFSIKRNQKNGAIIMSLKTINNDIKTAMKAKDKETLAVLRMIKTAIQAAEIDKNQI